MRSGVVTDQREDLHERAGAVGIARGARRDEAVDALDHRYLNELPPFDKINTTAENIARVLYERLSKARIQECSAATARSSLSGPIVIPQADFVAASDTSITIQLPNTGNAPSQFVAGFYSVTVVVTDGDILGKPATDEQAFTMQVRLRDRWHAVYTGIALLDAAGKVVDTVWPARHPPAWQRKQPKSTRTR